MGIVPHPDSDSGRYLALVAEYGHCVCGPTHACEEQWEPTLPSCQLCKHLDPEWPCPTLDDDADYPDVDP